MDYLKAREIGEDCIYGVTDYLTDDELERAEKLLWGASVLRLDLLAAIGGELARRRD